MVANIERSTAKALRAGKQYIYAWGDGHAEGDASMRDLLGGKGAGLAEMTKAGLPVPPGFTITTEACNDYFRNGEELPSGLWEDVLDRRHRRSRSRPARRSAPLRIRCSSACARARNSRCPA